MKFLKLLILCAVFFTMKLTAFAQVESRPKSAGSITNNITNQLSSIGWQRSGSNVFQFADGDLVGIGVATPTEILHLLSTATAPIFKFEGTNATPGSNFPIINLFTNAAGGDGQTIGRLDFSSQDDAAGTDIFVSMKVDKEDISASTEAGFYDIGVAINGTVRSFFALDGFNGTINQGEIIFNEESQDVDFRIEDDILANAFFLRGSDGFIGLGTGAPDEHLHLSQTSIENPELRLENTNSDALSAIFSFKKNGASAADDDRIGRTIYFGDDDAGNPTTYARVDVFSDRILNGSESGSMNTLLAMELTPRSFLKLDSFIGVLGQGQVTINDDSQDINFVIEADDDVNAIHMLGDSGHLGIGGIPDSDKELMLVSTLNANPQFKIESAHTGANGGTLEFVLSTSSGNDFDEPGSIKFINGDDAGTEETVAEIRGVMRDASAGITAGRIWFLIQHNGGVLNEYLTLSGSNGTPNQGEIIFNESGLDVDFRVESDTDPNAFIMIGSTSNVGIGTASPGAGLTMGNDNLIARDANAGLTAGTTQTQAGGLALTAEINEVSTVANANDTVVLPTAIAGLEITIINNGANAMRIFPASGNDLGAGNNTQMTTALATTDMITFKAYDATNWRGVRGAYVN